MIISRAWAMPSHDTVSIKPVKELVSRYISESKESCDPFARDCQIAKYTNDLNPSTKSEFHMKAEDFLKFIMVVKNIDLVLFDPPYSLRQVKECYNGVGVDFTQQDSQNAIRWTREREVIAQHQKAGDVIISFGWTSTCMGKKRGYEIIEILLVSHGSAHNDTIITVERKLKNPTLVG